SDSTSLWKMFPDVVLVKRGDLAAPVWEAESRDLTLSNLMKLYSTRVVGDRAVKEMKLSPHGCVVVFELCECVRHWFDQRALPIRMTEHERADRVPSDSVIRAYLNKRKIALIAKTKFQPRCRGIVQLCR